MTNAKRFVLPVFVLLIHGYAPIGNSDALVVLAKPTQITFVMAEGDLPEKQGGNKVYVGGVYRTTLKIRDVIYGVFAEDHVTVNLIATSRENLSKARTIVVVLSRTTDGRLTALGWNEPRTLACVPSSVDEKQEFRAAFPIELPNTQESCARLKTP